MWIVGDLFVFVFQVCGIFKGFIYCTAIFFRHDSGITNGVKCIVILNCDTIPEYGVFLAESCLFVFIFVEFYLGTPCV